MKGLSQNTEVIIEKLSLLDCLVGWTLVGGTRNAHQS